MNRFAPVLVCVAGPMSTAVARAALSLNINGPFSGMFPLCPNDNLPVPTDGVFDLVFSGDTVENGVPVNEGLIGYDLSLTVPQSMRGKFRITGADRPTGPDFVLNVASGATFRVAELDFNHVVINVSSNGDLADITPGKKAARINYSILDPIAFSFAGSGVVLTFDPAGTAFRSGDPARETPIDVGLTDVGFISMCPEPHGLFFLALPALLSLRPRRTK